MLLFRHYMAKSLKRVRMIRLEIYISEKCWSCQESIRIAEELTPLFPDVTIDLIDIQENDVPEEVFAVPTYLLNGKVVSLGNPTREELIEKLSAVQSTQSIS